MAKKYVVRPSEVVQRLLGTSQKVERGIEETLNGRKNPSSAAKKLLSEEQETQLIAKRLGSPPKEFANWSLRLLARQVVALEIAPAISDETVRRVLKKGMTQRKIEYPEAEFAGQHGTRTGDL